MTSRRLIGFTGLKGSGKDTAASVLIDRGWAHVKMAGALKEMLRSLLAYQFVAPDYIDRMLEGDLKEEPTKFLGGRTPRYAMQQLGTAYGRDILAENFWIEVARDKLRRPDYVVCTDVRFPNEAALIRELGGVLVRIDRPGLVAEQHASETQVADLYVDEVLENDEANAEDFKQQARWFFAGIGLSTV